MKQIQPNLWMNQHKADSKPNYWVGQLGQLEGPYDSIEEALGDKPKAKSKPKAEEESTIVELEAVVKPVE